MVTGADGVARGVRVSNILDPRESDCPAHGAADNAIELVLEPRERDLGGFSVRRLLPTQRRRMVGPWIFFDQFGPAAFAPGKGIDVRPHPHIGIATVTYLFEGELVHRDSLGSHQVIRPGDINLMVAGRGIVHSEREADEAKQGRRHFDGLQLWLALPDADEETDPAFFHYAANDIPTTDVVGVAVRVMIGSAFGVTSPVRTFSETLYLEARLTAGQELVLPKARERAVYVLGGGVESCGETLDVQTMAVFADAPGIRITATEDSRIAMIGGDPVGERFIDWNFVSSRKDRIEQARDDWREGRFPKVPGDEIEFIPLPEDAKQ